VHRDDGPLDPFDPRFEEPAGAPMEGPRRALVAARGPGYSPENPRARVLRAVLPLLFAAALAALGLGFWIGLAPSSGVQVVGPEDAIRAAVADRPHRVCLGEGQPCAWLTLVDGELIALDTSGPLREEFGRLGVAWCPSSGYFGSNTSGSRFDPLGRVARGPAPRGLDRFGLRRNGDELAVDFLSRQTGLQARRTSQLLPPTGPHCEEIPFDRDADLRL
jgi:hypothetical protein